jgi:trehalose-6-phosphate synthase
VLCDIIGFHTFRHAFNLLSSLNKEFDKNFEIKNQGNLVMNYSGREILIYIKKAECDYNFLKKLKKNIKNNNNELNDKFKKLTENKFSFLSINNIENPEILFITLKAYEIFLEKNINNNNKDNFILVFFLLTDNNNTKNNNNDKNNNLSEIDLLIDKKIQIIKEKYGEECIYLERKNDFFSIKEQIKIFGYFNILLYLQIEIWNGLITYGNEFIALQQENKKFGVIINEVIVINKNLKSIYIINPYNKIRIYEGMQYYYNKNINEINSNYKQDMSIIQKFNSMNWILKFLYNLKRLIIEQSNNKKSTVGFGFNLRIMKLNMNFNHLNLDLLKSSYISSKKVRIFFLNYFSLIETNDI